MTTRCAAFALVFALGCGGATTSGATTPQPEPSGGLTAQEIRDVIQRNLGEVQRCYELGLARRSDLAGTVTVAFLITPEGNVGGAAVADSTVPDAEVGSCIRARVLTWRFPRPSPPGPVQVRFPFNLSQSGG